MRYALAILALTTASPAFADDATAPGDTSAPAEEQIATHAPTPLFRPEGHVTVASWPQAVSIAPASDAGVQQAVLIEPSK